MIQDCRPVPPFDVTTLPVALLPLAKQHSRIDTTADDALVTSICARAVARFEAVNGISLNPSTWLWKPVSLEFCNGQARVPREPVKAFTVRDAAAVDISSSYSMIAAGGYGAPILYLVGAWLDGMTVSLETGFVAGLGDPLPPGVLDVVLRNAAHLYEHREILIPDREFIAPDLQIDATWWVPRI